MTAGAEIILAAFEGIDRRKADAGANPRRQYDLLNGYISAAGDFVSRPGTVEDADLPEGTFGLCAFDDELVVFAIEDVGALPAGYALEIIQHPETPTTALARIHFADAFMGKIHVTAEFVDGRIADYWCVRAEPWVASTVYREGDVVEPTVENGHVYRAKRTGAPNPVWAPNVARANGDKVEPTAANGYYYTVTDTNGANPRSGAAEPTWPTEDGAVVYEDTDLTLPGLPTVGDPGDIDTQLPDDIEDRYGNIGGGDSLSDTLRRLQNL